VEVAILVGGDDLVTLAQGEGYGGSLTGLKSLALVALLGLQGDPLDIVLFDHGVFHAAHGDGNDVALNSYDGDMLFAACFNYACLDLGHLLTAAHHRNAGLVDHTDKVAALLANIKLVLVTHSSKSPFH
jgi:hypothetical protein